LYRLPQRASTAEEWALLEPLIPAPKPGGQPARCPEERSWTPSRRCSP